jgi:1-deoxy-D-xylulose-5-phosphate reductoisomerase
MARPKRIAILGSTGSVGKSALDVIKNLDGLEVWAISGMSQVDLLKQQSKEFSPRLVGVADNSANGKVTDADFINSGEASPELLIGQHGLVEIASAPEVDIVLAAIVGFAGLESALAAVRCGKQLALANKETLVVAGHLITELAKESGTKILPVDSEHSAIFQAMQAGREKEISKVILTASGGPFRSAPKESLASVTVEQALDHPTWEMGKKISIDSATMMNKALEIIEAKWLFGLTAQQIEVVIHPQSVVHSMVTFQDQSTIAQLSPPDMRLPIQYAFTWPDRVPGPAPAMDWSQSHQLDFLPPNFDRFPALRLGFEVAEKGGSSGAVVNAANEAAVDAFLKSELSFTDIVTACREVLEHHNFEAHPSLEQLVAADRWAREEISKWIAA